MTEWRFLHRGDFIRIEVSVKPGKRSYRPAIEQQIEREWEKATAANPGLYNGIAFSLLACSVEGGTLHLTLHETDYKSFIGTNATHAQELTDPNDRADIMAACCVCVTSDNKIILGKRSAQQAQGAGLWHVIGGNMDIIDPYQLMRREIVEETGIDDDHILSIRCVTLGVCNRGKKPELIFQARLDCDEQCVRTRLSHAFDADEHTEIRFVPVQDLKRFIEENMMVPVGRAAIEEYLRRPQ